MHQKAQEIEQTIEEKISKLGDRSLEMLVVEKRNILKMKKFYENNPTFYKGRH